jgi:hypothetical protein
VLLISFQVTSSVLLVEGLSDEAALRALASRFGRDLAAEGVAIVPIGGAQAVRRAVRDLGAGVNVAGLCDVGEERHFRRALGPERVYVCVADLEDELVRALGPDAVLTVIEARGELASFRTYQKQPAHRMRTLEEQLHGFMWNRKVEYARLLVHALDLDGVPAPLLGALAQV